MRQKSIRYGHQNKKMPQAESVTACLRHSTSNHSVQFSSVSAFFANLITRLYSKRLGNTESCIKNCIPSGRFENILKIIYAFAAMIHAVNPIIRYLFWASTLCSLRYAVTPVYIHRGSPNNEIIIYPSIYPFTPAP